MLPFSVGRNNNKLEKFKRKFESRLKRAASCSDRSTTVRWEVGWFSGSAGSCPSLDDQQMEESSGCSDDTGPAQKKGPAGGVGRGYLPLLVAAAAI